MWLFEASVATELPTDIGVNRFSEIVFIPTLCKCLLDRTLHARQIPVPQFTTVLSV